MAHGIDPYEWEIYEHWAVSQWLADKLIAQDERVDTDFAGLNILGAHHHGPGDRHGRLQLRASMPT